MHELNDQQLREMLQRLRRFALWLTRDASSADDLVQATVERALSRRSQQREQDSLRAWLFSILYRQFIDGKRRERRHARWLSWFARAQEQGNATEDIVLAQSGLAAFALLPTDQRALLLLISVEGLSYKEAAQALDVPIGTVMSRLSRARAALRELAEGTTASPVMRRLK
ncbi:sigma-70 family RNA polymerase sigma factor [Pseudomonas sp. P66]|uniref:Sigma-70 family RNA polymerase sigma factor n=1 Tax=Pseudomonas arcuscaelestis TaxID=2710591 RepID=A0ABS2BTI4_9PSED|nr:sigma-70 family RNA polymerase sigma factor [Pseudomonas arcuscaelestis]MBM3104497.1 sigma-70 family RNA polymerase sigma factor [Pseudomonas arcuscaelestis]MBM3112112.1 sigma-70 family RNA polymerase sigma factor [Pseudomonas arcuscaelestis]MBM5456926.1 sigma-70 family RNA polymerase sigma factor [Pseudomonas arcuscaelestis]